MSGERESMGIVCEMIDTAVSPPMSRRQAIEWLEELQAHVESRIDGLNEDLAELEDNG